jgi:hypothetical protein
VVANLADHVGLGFHELFEEWMRPEEEAVHLEMQLGRRHQSVPPLKLPIVALASPSASEQTSPGHGRSRLGAESSAGEDLVKKEQSVAPRLVVAPWINEIDIHSGGRGRGAAARSGSFLSSLGWERSVKQAKTC